MLEAELFDIFIQRLNDADAAYMVTGSVASIIYGQPRMTHDIDVVIEVSSARLAELICHFPLSDFYCPPIEVIKTEISRENRGHFNVIHHQTGFKADMYPVGSDPFIKEALNRRRKIDRKGKPLWVAPPEYVIIKKLQYFAEGRSSKHLGDIRGMLTISGDLIDHELLLMWVEQFNLKEFWRLL